MTNQAERVECLLVGDSTLDPLVDRLGAASVHARTRVAPYDQVSQVLLDSSMSCWTPTPYAVVVWTRPERALASFERLQRGEDIPGDVLLSEVEAFSAMVLEAASRTSLVLVASWAVPPDTRGVGMRDFRDMAGLAPALMRANLRLAEKLAAAPNAFVLDGQRWMACGGARARDPKMWFLGKIAYAPAVFDAAAADIDAAIAGSLGGARKLIVVDLDDTLWGGVLGEVGWEKLRLGGMDPVGEAYVEFQRQLLAFKKRGVLLAIVSKNEEAIALEAIERHPEMVLRKRDFAAWRINWSDKAANVADVIAELNLGMQSAVFIDDHPIERARVRETFPEILVPDWPEDPALFGSTLRSMRCFDAPAVTEEDRSRTEQYVAERARQDLKKATASLEDWLAGLGLCVTARTLAEEDLGRAAQLLNKTNQFNLTTRRMSEKELWDYSQADDHIVLVFRVRDRFSDYGLTGLASLALEPDGARMEDFLISCRVMGRGVEEAMLTAVVERARRLASGRLIGCYLPTPKNHPCAEFLFKAGFAPESEGCYAWNLNTAYDAPAHLRLIDQAESTREETS